MMLTPCLSLGHAGAHLLLPSLSFIFVGPLSSSWRVFSSVVVVVFVIILHCCRYRYRRRVVIGIRFMLALCFPIGFRRQFELVFGLSLCYGSFPFRSLLFHCIRHCIRLRIRFLWPFLWSPCGSL